MSAEKNKGFTLIELMITVVVVAILAAIAYPSYQDFLRRGYQSAAQQLALDIAQREEQYFLDAKAYATWAQLGVVVPPEVDERYDVPSVNLTANGYVIELRPDAGIMVNRSRVCFNSLTQRWLVASTSLCGAAPAPGNVTW